jgi:hypothetical protein
MPSETQSVSVTYCTTFGNPAVCFEKQIRGFPSLPRDRFGFNIVMSTSLLYQKTPEAKLKAPNHPTGIDPPQYSSNYEVPLRTNES